MAVEKFGKLYFATWQQDRHQTRKNRQSNMQTIKQKMKNMLRQNTQFKHTHITIKICVLLLLLFFFTLLLLYYYYYYYY